MERERIYLAGPMTGIPQFNFPLFIRVAALIRATSSFEVVSPAELDDEADRQRAMASPDGGVIHYESGKTWGDFLARDVKLITDGTPEGPIHSLFVLPGWERSSGARTETFVGNGIHHKPVFRFIEHGEGDWSYDPVTKLQLVRAWAEDEDLIIYRQPFRTGAEA